MKTKGCVRYFLSTLLILTSLCLLLLVISAVSNRFLPTRSNVVDRLSELDKARLAEVNHLRQELGDSVLPGWSQAEILIIVYNEENLFLSGSADPTDGWQSVPGYKQMGSAWQVAAGDDLYGQPYYTQRIPASGETTQAFTVRVGEDWAASLSTHEWAKILLVDEIGQEIPSVLRPVVPFRVITGLLLPNSDSYICAIMHEAAHAYQGTRAPERLNAAEQSAHRNSKNYPWEDQALIDDWQVELDLLRDAMRVSSDEETLRLARAFLDQRSQRRQAAKLPDELIDYERQREWEEGIAKYAERKIYLLAANPALYTPLPVMANDPDFNSYRGAQRKWDQEVDQISREAKAEGDGRFYYTGYAQAVMLDRLSPGWKERLFDDGVWLEDLLTQAVTAAKP